MWCDDVCLLNSFPNDVFFIHSDAVSIHSAQRLADKIDLVLVKDVTSPDLLRWVRCSNKNGPEYFPCAVRVNHDEAQGLALKLTKSKPILIQYLGRKAPFSGQRDAVSEARLSPATTTTTTTSSSSSSNNKKWDAEKMKSYLDYLRKSQTFRDATNQSLDLKVEELVLQRFLEQVYSNSARSAKESSSRTC